MTMEAHNQAVPTTTEASTLTATTCLTASIEMEANQETHGGRHTAVKLLPSCRDGGDLSYGGSFPKSDTKMEADQ